MKQYGDMITISDELAPDGELEEVALREIKKMMLHQASDTAVELGALTFENLRFWSWKCDGMGHWPDDEEQSFVEGDFPLPIDKPHWHAAWKGDLP